MRVVVSVLILVLMPAACFFLWAWLVAMARERRLAGTLPHWQELPWTWLIIAGLTLALAAILYMVLLTDRPEGGWFGPPRDGAAWPAAEGRRSFAGSYDFDHGREQARIAPAGPALAITGRCVAIGGNPMAVPG